MSRQGSIRQKCPGCAWIRQLGILVLAAVACLRVDSDQWLPRPGPAWKRYATNVGGIRRIILQDGTQVDLNTGSEIKVRFTGAQREVVLTHGEALFTLVHRTSWPFSVRAGDATIHAAGTRFSVRLREQAQADVLVIDGHIAIDVGQQAAVANVPRSHRATPFALFVSAGESIAMNSITVLARAQLPPATLKRRTAWTDGWLWFCKDPLPQAVAEFNRYHREQLVLVDPALAAIEIGGRFRSSDLDSFIATLEHAFDVRALSSAVHGTGIATIYLSGTCVRARQQCNWPMVQ